MKKLVSLALAVLMIAALAACGSKGGSKDVDLTAYYDSMAEQLNWDENYMAEMPQELLDTYYPGLGDIETKQFIARAPMMSAVASEMVLMECNTPEDAQKASEILQKRLDEQADGGAWYPETIESWKKGQVVVNEKYAALIVSGESQKTLTDAYNALFQ